MKTLQTYWPKMRTLDRAILALQAVITGTNAIILLVNPSWAAAGIFAISLFVLCVLTVFTITEVQARLYRQQHKEQQ